MEKDKNKKSIEKTSKSPDLEEAVSPEIQATMKAFWERYNRGEVFKEPSLAESIREANFDDYHDGSLQTSCEWRLK